MSEGFSSVRERWGLARRLAGVLVRFLPILAIGAMAFGLAPSAGCGKGVFSEVSSSATASAITQTATSSSSATPSARPTFAFNTSLSIRGSGSQVDSTDGTCSGQPCSSATCQCLTFSGTLSSKLLGDSDWIANLTVNLDGCINTGTMDQFCCIGDTVVSVTNGSATAPNVLALSFTGPTCADPNSSNISFWGDFIVLSASSSGKFANATGTGQINFFSGLTDENPPVYLAAQGEIALPSK